jgi:hypothetical protein
MDNQTGNVMLFVNTDPLNGWGDNQSLKTYTPFKLYIEGTSAPKYEFQQVVHYSQNGDIHTTPNTSGSNFFGTGQGLHVNKGITHLSGKTLIGSPFRKLNPHQQGLADLAIANNRPLLARTHQVSSDGEYLGDTPNAMSSNIEIAPSEWLNTSSAVPIHSCGGKFDWNVGNYVGTNQPFGPIRANLPEYEAAFNVNHNEDAKLTINATDFSYSPNALQVYGKSTFDAFNNSSVTEGGTNNWTNTSPIAITVTGSIEVNGYFFTTNTVQVTSDRKLKKNIKYLNSQLDKIKTLKPREFEWKSSSKEDIGFIAQEIQEVYPSLVKEKDDTLFVNYSGLVPMLTKGIQEQQELIEKLSLRIDELEKKLNK